MPKKHLDAKTAFFQGPSIIFEKILFDEKYFLEVKASSIMLDLRFEMN